MPLPSPLLLFTLLSLVIPHLPSPSSANEGNLITTGDILYPDAQLSIPGVAFVNQRDCNLVLYGQEGVLFESRTDGLGSNCTVALSDCGQLQIKDGQRKVIWSTNSSGPKGEYAAILQPNGQVGIFGPALWTTSQTRKKGVVSRTVDEEKIVNEPNVPNLLFSSEVLNENSKLASRDYAFEVKEGCSLAFTKAATDSVLWASPRGTERQRHCFLRLNHRGQLALVDDDYGIVWKTKAANADGLSSVLVVKINGEAVIYGDRIWST